MTTTTTMMTKTKTKTKHDETTGAEGNREPIRSYRVKDPKIAAQMAPAEMTLLTTPTTPATPAKPTTPATPLPASKPTVRMLC